MTKYLLERSKVKKHIDSSNGFRASYDADYASVAESRYNFGPLKGHGKAIVVELLKNLKGGEIILEVGCGTGDFQKQLKEQFGGLGFKIIGLDPNVKAVVQAKTVNQNVLMGKAEKLPFENESVDIVCSLHTYEHVPDLGTAFGEIHRVLKQGGKAYIIVPPNLGGLETIRVAKKGLTDDEANGLRGWVNALKYARKLHCSNLGGPFGGAKRHVEKILKEHYIDLRVFGGMRADLFFANFLTLVKPLH